MAAAAATGDPEIPRLRGEIVHRALESLGRGGELPGEAGLAAALRQEGLEAAHGAAVGPGAPGGVGGLPPRPLAGGPARSPTARTR